MSRFTLCIEPVRESAVRYLLTGPDGTVAYNAGTSLLEIDWNCTVLMPELAAHLGGRAAGAALRFGGIEALHRVLDHWYSDLAAWRPACGDT